MRKLSLALITILTLTASLASAATISLTKSQDMSFKLDRVAGKATYSGSELRSVKPALIQALQSTDASSVTSFVPSVVLTKADGNDATLTLACRYSTTTYPIAADTGNDCSSIIASPITGIVYLSVFPVSVTFHDSTKVGVYGSVYSLVVDIY